MNDFAIRPKDGGRLPELIERDLRAHQEFGMSESATQLARAAKVRQQDLRELMDGPSFVGAAADLAILLQTAPSGSVFVLLEVLTRDALIPIIPRRHGLTCRTSRANGVIVFRASRDDSLVGFVGRDRLAGRLGGVPAKSASLEAQRIERFRRHIGKPIDDWLKIPVQSAVVDRVDKGSDGPPLGPIHRADLSS
ncbi:hypothetical protein [Consotaella salsifontis]|uniref:hypothetical protein n=1 Tax=Consotaella salsifontis TaxID=1365950 RepID=UPI0013F5FF4D|nr:hypothetical protein [Consotaella salsifontis]